MEILCAYLLTLERPICDTERPFLPPLSHSRQNRALGPLLKGICRETARPLGPARQKPLPRGEPSASAQPPPQLLTPCHPTLGHIGFNKPSESDRAIFPRLWESTAKCLLLSGAHILPLWCHVLTCGLDTTGLPLPCATPSP